MLTPSWYWDPFGVFSDRRESDPEPDTKGATVSTYDHMTPELLTEITSRGWRSIHPLWDGERFTRSGSELDVEYGPKGWTVTYVDSDMNTQEYTDPDLCRALDQIK